MSFITRADFSVSIASYILDDLIEFDEQTLQLAIKRAISNVADYLNSRFDVTEIFNKTGDDRHDSVIDACVQIALYKLYSRSQPTAIPEHVAKNYAIQIEWLQGVNEGTINPIGLPVVANGVKDAVRFGGNTKRNNDW